MLPSVGLWGSPPNPRGRAGHLASAETDKLDLRMRRDKAETQAHHGL